MPAPKKGFTLIELLVVIAIIAILSVIGFTVFTNAQKGARDSKRRGDINTIAKAYEVNYSSGGNYTALAGTNFTGNTIPQDPTKGDYYNVVATDGSGYKVCASLENNSSQYCNSTSSSCVCITSSQGTIANINQSNLSGPGSSIGYGYSSSAPSCDTTGTLMSGLVGYWKMEEVPPSGWVGANSVIDSSGNNNHGTANGGASPIVRSPALTGSSYAGNFNGTTGYVSIGAGKFDSLIDATVSLWFYYTGSFTTNNVFFSRWKDTINRMPVFVSFSGGYGNKIVYENAVGGNFRGGPSDNTISANTWYHVALLCGSGGMHMYVDGVKQGMTSATTDCFSAIAPSAITEFASHGGGPSFPGEIDDVRIYNRALSQTEVTNLYNSGNGCF